MELGLNAIPLPEDEWYWRDLGVTWCKWGVDLDGLQVRDDRLDFERAANLGIRTCVDLRTACEWMTRMGMQAYNKLAQEGKMEPKPADDAPFEEHDRIIRANQAKTNQVVLELIAQHVSAYVEAHRDYCRDWEWWGEWNCPATSQGIFHIICYPETLKVVHAAIKEVQPEARVWTGGNGMDLNDGWVKGLQQDGALKAFDALNWHPYPMSMRDRHKIEERLHENYSGWRKTLDAEGLGQWYTSTEWGYPSLQKVSRAQRQWLTSQVVEGGITQLYPDEALEFYEGDLRIMEEHDFQVVMVHTLRDSPTRFWGTKCGLLTIPIPGLKGRLARAFWKRIETKPVYRLVREWARKGAAGPPAFTRKPEPELLVPGVNL